MSRLRGGNRLKRTLPAHLKQGARRAGGLAQNRGVCMIYGSGLVVNSLGSAKIRPEPDRRDWSGASADCVEKLRNQSVADFLRKPMKRNSRKALTTRQRMAARERM
ncbi:MAG: hypothetical protein GKR99_02740 [Rhodobacteraceae bacterium]|nr:hypothetical protein [Paracoccaceae bacterium]